MLPATAKVDGIRRPIWTLTATTIFSQIAFQVSATDSHPRLSSDRKAAQVDETPQERTLAGALGVGVDDSSSSRFMAVTYVPAGAQ